MTKQKALSLVGIVTTLLGLYLLYRIFAKQDLAALFDAVASAPAVDLVLASAFTLGSFLCIAVIEYLGVLYTRRTVPLPRIAATAVAALGVGHAIGLAALSSGAVRYRMYKRAGVGLASMSKILVFAGITVFVGLAGIGGICLLWQGENFAQVLGVAPFTMRFSGAVALTMVVLYCAVCLFRRRRLKLLRWRIRVPSFPLALAQVLVGNINVLCIGGALYASLRGFASVDYMTATTLYVGSDVSAMIGHVPGGWGVLEYIVTSVLTDQRVLAGIVLFRTIYFLVPLGIGLIVFLADEVIHRGRIGRSQEGVAPAT